VAVKIYLDTNVYKLSATELPRYRVEMKQVSGGGKTFTLPLHTPVVINPNDRLDENSEIKVEALLLPTVASLAEEGIVNFLIGIETQVELSFIPNLDSRTGYFYNAPRTMVEPPVRYGRVLYGGIEDPKQAQYAFLKRLQDPRFLELRKMCGAEQGNDVNRNQLLDAFHLWCAEYHDCEYFLSLDFKLARVTANSRKKPRCRVVRPSELLAALGIQY
jgi:hypothetical protein